MLKLFQERRVGREIKENEGRAEFDYDLFDIL
jgi:hypothetical protein